MSNKILMELL